MYTLSYKGWIINIPTQLTTSTGQGSLRVNDHVNITIGVAGFSIAQCPLSACPHSTLFTMAKAPMCTNN